MLQVMAVNFLFYLLKKFSSVLASGHSCMKFQNLTTKVLQNNICLKQSLMKLHAPALLYSRYMVYFVIWKDNFGHCKSHPKNGHFSNSD